MIDWEAFKGQIQASPKKMLGYVLSLSVCFLLIWLLVAIRFDTPAETETGDQTGRLDSLRISLNAGQSDTVGSAAEVPAQPEITRQNSGSRLGDMLPVFLILMTAILMLWVWKKKDAAGTQKASFHNDLFQIVGRQEVSSGQELLVVKMNNEFWVLGSGMNGLQLLHRYAPENWDGPVPQNKGEGKKSETFFSSILKARESKVIQNTDANQK